MNTRRSPFQFCSTDPLARQRELEKRFGLQPSCPKMYIDVNNPLSMGTSPRESSSPRLQHRVPIFAEGYDQPIHSSSVDSMASIPENKKPNVRVIPIEVEGADGRSQRHRTYSGPAGRLKDHDDVLASERKDRFPFKRFNFEDAATPPKSKPVAEPRIYNIPIKVENSNIEPSNLKAGATTKPKSATPRANGCSVSKSTKDDKVQPEKSVKENEVLPEPASENKADKLKNNFEKSLKKIEDVLAEFKAYETGVLEFSGTSKDKQYRYLDEMLTRCMLRLDDVDTMGNEEIRMARKNAVKKVQASIDLLENKANIESVTTVEAPCAQLTPAEDSAVIENNKNDVEMKDNCGNDNMDVLAGNESNYTEAKEMDLPADNDLNKVSSITRDNDAKADFNEDLKVKSADVTSSVEVTSIEMSELVEDKMTPNENSNQNEMQKLNTSLEGEIKELSKMANDHVTSNEECSVQQISTDEVEMAEESLDKINLSSSCESESAEQNEVSCEIVTSDIEMLDQKDDLLNLTEVESLDKIAEETSNLSKPNEASEIEMVDSEAISCTESEKIECEPVNQNSDCLKENVSATDPNMQINSPKDAEMKDIHNTLDDVLQSTVECASDLAKDINCIDKVNEPDMFQT